MFTYTETVKFSYQIKKSYHIVSGNMKEEFCQYFVNNASKPVIESKLVCREIKGSSSEKSKSVHYY